MSNPIYEQKRCKWCNKEIIKNQFCNLSCQASYGNAIRPKEIQQGVGIKLAQRAAHKRKTLEYQYNKNPKRCKCCNSSLSFQNKNNTFCNSACSAKYNNDKRERRTEKSRQKTSETLKIIGHRPPPKYGKHNSQYKNGKYMIAIRICPVCHTSVYIGANKTCGKQECIRTAHANHKTSQGCWFYNKYQKIMVYLQSSWELEIAKHLTKENIKWIRPKPLSYITDKERLYYPDFYLVDFDVYLDPKNDYILVYDQPKLNAVIKKHSIKLIYGHYKKILDEIDSLNQKA